MSLGSSLYVVDQKKIIQGPSVLASRSLCIGSEWHSCLMSVGTVGKEKIMFLVSCYLLDVAIQKSYISHPLWSTGNWPTQMHVHTAIKTTVFLCSQSLFGKCTILIWVCCIFIPAAHCLYELGFRSIRFASVVHQCLISYDLEKWRCVIVCSTWWDIHSMSRNVARYNFDTHQLIWLILGEMLACVSTNQKLFYFFASPN